MKFDKNIICIKVISGSASDEELNLFKEWMSKSQINKSHFELIKKIWTNSSAGAPPEIPDIDSLWLEFNKKIVLMKNSQLLSLNRTNVIKILINKLFANNLRPAIAGIAVIILVVSSLFINKYETHQVKSVLIICSTNYKEIKNIILPDGSSVDLNSGSAIEYYNPFRNNCREIKLRGEAFFSVKKDKSPFIISSENAFIKVLGTKFIVKTINHFTRVVVKEGKVNFSPKGLKNESVVLSKNQMSKIIINNKPALPKNIDFENYDGWLKGELVFNQSSLDEVKNDYEKYFNTNLEFDSTLNKEYSLTGSFKNMNAETALSMICLALNLDYKVEKNGYFVLPKETQKKITN